MGERNVEIIEERVRIRTQFIERARLFSECVTKYLPDSAIIVYGSVARGDFNAWSDIDVAIITKNSVPSNPLHRLDIIYECLLKEPIVEPIVLKEEEFNKLLVKKNPMVLEIIEKGIVLVDRINLISSVKRKRN